MSVAELSISRSNIKEVDEEIFNGLEQNLVKLSIQESRLTYVPRGINKISSLRRLDLEGNNITELYPYSFYGASITSLSLSSNRLSGLTENAFLGLEGNLRTLSLSSNRIRNFPSTAVKNLQNLETLKLGNLFNVTLPILIYLTFALSQLYFYHYTQHSLHYYLTLDTSVISFLYFIVITYIFFLFQRQIRLKKLLQTLQYF